MHRMHPRDFFGGQGHGHVVAQRSPLRARENTIGIVLNLVGPHIHEPFLLSGLRVSPRLPELN
ncbi:Uncharacterised protein [Mycobacterium tuberculosis]|nr:Uncharacterised protein [Mycobacterium tuberculosis]